MVTLACLKNKACSGVHNFLEFLKEMKRTARQKSVTIVKFRENKGTDKSVCCLDREILTDGTDFSEFKVC